MNKLLDFMIDICERFWLKFKINAPFILIFSIAPALLFSPSLIAKIPFLNNPAYYIVLYIILFFVLFSLLQICHMSVLGEKVEILKLLNVAHLFKPFIVYLFVFFIYTGLIVLFFNPQLAQMPLNESIIESIMPYIAMIAPYKTFLLLFFFLLIPFFVYYLHYMFAGKGFIQSFVSALDVLRTKKSNTFLLLSVLFLLLAFFNVFHTTRYFAPMLIMIFFGMIWLEYEKEVYEKENRIEASTTPLSAFEQSFKNDSRMAKYSIHAEKPEYAKDEKPASDIPEAEPGTNRTLSSVFSIPDDPSKIKISEEHYGNKSSTKLTACEKKEEIQSSKKKENLYEREFDLKQNRTHVPEEVQIIVEDDLKKEADIDTSIKAKEFEGATVDVFDTFVKPVPNKKDTVEITMDKDKIEDRVGLLCEDYVESDDSEDDSYENIEEIEISKMSIEETLKELNSYGAEESPKGQAQRNKSSKIVLNKQFDSSENIPKKSKSSKVIKGYFDENDESEILRAGKSSTKKTSDINKDSSGEYEIEI